MSVAEKFSCISAEQMGFPARQDISCGMGRFLWGKKIPVLQELSQGGLEGACCFSSYRNTTRKKDL